MVLIPNRRVLRSACRRRNESVGCIVLEYVDGGGESTLEGRLPGASVEVGAAGPDGGGGAERGSRSFPRRQVLHRDLKPSNIMFDKNGTPKITDFGLANATKSNAATRGKSGDAGVHVPRAGPGESRSSRPTDMYALGVILYELLAGRRPFKGGTPMELIMQVQSSTAPSRRRRSGIPIRDLDGSALSASQNDPERRYLTAADLADDLERFLAGKPVAARPSGAWDRLRAHLLIDEAANWPESVCQMRAAPRIMPCSEVRMDKIKVLLFAANPRGTAPLDLPREFREIDEEVRLSTFRGAVELILVPGTRPVDLLRKLNENQPQVVHFSSHGSPDEIVLESGEEEAEARGRYGPTTRSTDERDMKKVRPDEVESESIGQGQPQLVSKSALVNVLRSCDEGNLRLVVLERLQHPAAGRGADRGRRLRRQHEPDHHRPGGDQVRGVVLRGAGVRPVGAEGVRPGRGAVECRGDRRVRHA